MMPSCRCFARRVKGLCGTRRSFPVQVCAVQVLVPTSVGYCAWGCFRIFCLAAALACRAAELSSVETRLRKSVWPLIMIAERVAPTTCTKRHRRPGRERMQRTLRLLAVIAGLCASTLAAQADAAKYPVRPVKIMVGFSAGGPVDVVARIIADRLGNKLGQPFVVENRAGANGMIAAEGVARAEADGYTMLACNSSTITLNKTLFKDIRYDPISDL